MAPESKDKSAVGVFTTDIDLVIRVWDDSLATMTGIPPATAIGMHLTELIPDLAERGILARFERVRDSGTTEVLAPAFHKSLIPCPPKQSSSQFAEMRQAITISPLRGDKGIDGVIVVIEDVTQRIEHERDFAAKLRDPDDTVRLRAAKELAKGAGPLHSSEAAPVIRALGDKNWRVRRSAVDSLAKRAAPDAVAALLDAVREEHLDFGMLNGALQVLQATSIDTTQSLIEILRDSDDQDLRMQAALALGQQNKEVAIGPLLEALNDPDQNVRYHVIEALGNHRAPEAVDPLMAIAESRDFFLSFAALEALKQIGDHSVAPRVARLLDDVLLREAAAGTLGATGDLKAAEEIVQLLNEGKLDPAAVAPALWSLSEGYTSADSGENPVAEAVRESVNADGAAAVLAALDSPDRLTQKETVGIAGWIGGEEIIARLATLIDDPPLRAAVLDALAKQGEAAVLVLIEKLNSEDAEVRSGAARLLGSIGGAKGIDALVEAMSLDNAIAPAVVEALLKSTSGNAAESLIGLLSSPDRTVRRVAVNGLRRSSRSDIIEQVHELLAAEDPNVREAALRVIGSTDTARARDAIIAACSDADEDVRIAAVEQLGSLVGDKALEAAARLLKDDSPRVRSGAAQALATYKDGGPTYLRQALEDPDAWVRYFSIRSLSANGGAAESLDQLRELAAKDPAEHVRVAATEAVKRAR